MLESGTRELTGEWVVGTDVWRRLKSERRTRTDGKRVTSTSRLTTNNVSRLGRMALNGLGAIRGGRDSPDLETDNESAIGKKGGAEKVIYYIHGGAYYVGNAATHRLITIGVSKACNARVFGESFSF
jgi:acetyl esterase/lipase